MIIESQKVVSVKSKRGQLFLSNKRVVREGMISYRFCEEKNIIYVKREGIISFKEVIVHIDNIYKTFQYLKDLRIVDDIGESISNYDAEWDLNHISQK